MTRRRVGSRLAALASPWLAPLPVVAALAPACTCDSPEEPSPPKAAAPATPAAAPRQLYLGDAGIEFEVNPAPEPSATPARCPSEMVDVAGEFCIDRYEVSLVEQRLGRRLSPFYPPTRERTQKNLELWQHERSLEGPDWARELGLPSPPAWQLEDDFEPRAVAIDNALPSGYLSGRLAARACANAGKRLCTEAEWSKACRGERDTQYPYGSVYVAGACNVSRTSHPARILHGNASVGHSDPRLNLTSDAEGPLLRATGSLPLCASYWGDDAIYDMVGNLDEWIDDPSGVFVGGFFSRRTQAGCSARIASHEYGYYDYSLGTRCCQ